MKNILIITFYYPPCNGTPAPRPASWAKVFAAKGYGVTVVTRHWTDKDNSWDDYIADTHEKEPIINYQEGVKVAYLPYKKKKYYKSPILSKISTFLRLAKGYLETEVDTFQFLPYIQEELTSKKYDLIIVSAPPWNIVRLASVLFDKYCIPIAVDYRDFENDMTLNLKPTPTKSRQIEFLLNQHYMLKWTKKAALIIVASYAIGDYIKRKIGKNYIEILNGYDEMVICNTQISKRIEPIFNITVLGYLYPAQELNIFYEGFKLFLEKVPDAKIHCHFIGQLALPSVAKEIEHNIPPQYFTLTKRVSFEKSIELGRKAHVLFYAGWKNWTGVYSAKMATYIALHRNILIAPSDHDVIEKMVITSNAGKIANNATEFFTILYEWYQEWLKTGEVVYKGDEKEIVKYSRENQAIKLLDYIEKHILI